MHATSNPPPIQLEWLANAKARPGALRLWAAGTPDAAAWAALAALTELPELAAHTPMGLDAACAAALPPETVAALADVGVAAWPDGQLLQADSTWPTQVAAGQWVAGAWYQQPPPSASAAQAASRARALKLMQLVNADADTRDIEAELRLDATLSYHLLRLVNGVALRGQREIGSFAQAILLLGRQQLRRWLHLMLFSARDDDPRAAMLTARVMLRARTLELAAEALGQDKAAQERAFMAGLFSLLGVLFGQPLPEVLRPLGLADELLAALLRSEGALGALLLRVSQAEAPLAAAPPLAADDTHTGELSPTQLTRLQLQAALWMGESQGPGGH